MSNFERLDGHLALEASDDAWADDGVVVAMGLAAGFTADDWASLAAAWRSRPIRWQVRCADLLSDVDPEPAAAILGEMIGSPHDEVAREAADALRSLLDGNPDVGLPAAVLPRAEALATRSRGLAAQDLNGLIEQLRARA